MPCDTVTDTLIEFGVKTDVDLLSKALAGLGESPVLRGNVLAFSSGVFDKQSGQLRINGYASLTEDTLRKAYGAEIAKREAAKLGWTLKPVAGQQFKFQAFKR